MKLHVREIVGVVVALFCLLLLVVGVAESEIVLPNNLQQISNECFSNCESITTVRIPNSVTQILPSAFQGCTALKAVYIPESVTEIANNAFDDCPDCVLYVFRNSDAENWGWLHGKSIEYISNEQHRSGDYYYSFNSSKTVTIIQYTGETTNGLVLPDTIDGYTVTGIGEQAFQWYEGTSIQLPSKLKFICSKAFYYSSISEFVLPNTLERIDGEAFMCCHSLTSINIPASVKTINGNAFRGCSHLESITVDPDNSVFGIFQNALISKTDMRIIVYPYALVGETFSIPDGIKIIGGTAFGYEGPQITTLIIPDSVEVIGGSSFSFNSVQHIQIGSGVNEMGYGPFSYCGSLKDVTIAEGTTVIGDGAFNHCGNLETITIPDSVTYIADNAFAYDYNVSIIANPGSYAAQYAEDKGLGNRKKYGDFLYEIVDDTINIIRYSGQETGTLVVPATIEGINVTSIGEKSFEYCPASAIVLPDTLQTIGHQAFYYCNAASINIPSSVTAIIGEAFMCCHFLTKIDIPASVTSMSGNPFRGCSRLQTINVDSGNTKYGIYSNALIEKSSMTLIVYPYALVTDTFTIPNGIKIIGGTAFGYEGPQITTLIIPDSVEFIGGSSFSFNSVQHIQIGSGVTGMGYGPFSYCGSLKTVTIAEGTTVIGDGAFNHCEGLESVSIPDSVTEIADNAFAYDYAVNIIGSSDSYAIQYAKNKGFAYIIK